MARVTDRAVTTDRATATFAPEQIGRTRYRTPEGFLCCEGARIARTGPMLYSAEEMPDIELGAGTMITVLRDGDVLFHPVAISSFSGKPLTNDHPDEPVTPLTYRQHSVGTVLNPRRGEGAEHEYLIADLLVTDAEAIAAIEANKTELSAGYDAEVEQIKPGIGRQTEIVGNHVALVKRGRGGPSCSIQDEEPTMAKRTTRILDGIRKAFRAKDEAALEEQLGKAEDMMDDEGEGDDPQRIVIEIAAPAAPVAAVEETVDEDPTEQRFQAIEGTLKSIADSVEELKKPPESTTQDAESEEEEDDDDKDVDKKTVTDAMSKAEILAPGIRMPTFDAAASTVKSATVTGLMRSALKAASADTSRKAHVDAVMGGRAADFDKMPAAQVMVVFDAASAVARAAHNSPAARPFDMPQGPMTAARLQERIVERRKAAL